MTNGPAEAGDRYRTMAGMAHSIEMSEVVPSSYEDVQTVLLSEPQALLADGRGESSMRVALSPALWMVRRVRIDHQARFEGEGLAFDLTCVAEGHPSLYPTFQGTLHVAPSGDESADTELRLAGNVSTPLPVGFNKAEASIRIYLHTVANRVAAAAAANHGAYGWHPAVMPYSHAE